MKTYILIYSDLLGSKQEVIDLLNSIPAINNWRTDITNSFFIKSESTADEIADSIIEKKTNVRFFISEISSNMQGWLPKDAWKFIKD
ncbi:hypothetical protein K6V25_13445 [Bacteroides salyersiae]|uniref:hypothetical protein n=1 Tax=Bacteroides salyersiae TaxID=291644 RepID=UPI001CC966DC|nr:hypothetical protein [Bacteroides salyersiae]UBD63953.1 hypothetical protein K6V25_13445 [Bacteroides salyersiae]